MLVITTELLKLKYTSIFYFIIASKYELLSSSRDGQVENGTQSLITQT